MPRKKDACTAQLSKYIQSRILSGEYPEGMRLPSVRRLAGKFHLGYGSVHRTLCTLCEDGVLELRPGDGFFVRYPLEEPSGPEGTFLVLCANYAMHRKTGLYHTALQGFQEYAQRAGYGVKVRELIYGEISESSLLEAAEGMSGVAFFYEIDLVFKRYPELRCPSVGLLVQQSWNGRISTVNLDAFSAGQEACNFFQNANLQTSMVKLCLSPKPVYQHRGMIFSMLWQSKGGETMRFAGDFYTETPGRECGYFFASDMLLHSAAEDYFRKTGRILTKDFVVMGMDGYQFLNPDFLRFPTLAADWKKMGEIACEELVRLCSSADAECRNLGITVPFVLPPEKYEIPGSFISK